MRSLLVVFVVIFSCSLGNGQTIPASFLDQLKTQLQTSSLHSSLNISGTADWTAGSTHESGSASLTARTDGSTEVLLGLSNTMRADTTGPLTSRTCQWIDSSGTSHDVQGGNCFIPVPWFSPFLVGLLLSAPSVVAVDDGLVTDGENTLHSVTLHTLISSTDASLVSLVASSTAATVLFDPVTLTPVVLKYSMHPDGDDTRSIPVRVEFSDFRTVSGISVPYHLDRYVNRTLQMRIQATAVTVQ